MCVYVCWLSLNEYYDRYANEQCFASQSLDNNTARQSTALSLTRPAQADLQTRVRLAQAGFNLAYDSSVILLPMYGTTVP